MKNFNYLNLSPFRWFVVNNFPFIEEDFDAITNYQLLCKVIEYLNKVIATTNETGKGLEELSKQFTDLYNYVNNFLDNLDLEEPINKKLDEMAEDGTLERLINQELFATLNLKLNNPLVGKYKTIIDDGKYNAWSVTLVMNDVIYCYYCKRVSHQSEDNKPMKGNSICMKSSTNGGLTWSEEKQIFYNPDYDYTTFGGVVLNNSSILLWVTEWDIDNNEDRYYQFVSTDGENFTKNYDFNNSTDSLVRMKGYLNMGIVTKNGRIITSKQVYDGDDNTRRTIVLYSDTAGNGWQAVEVFSKENDGNYNNMPWECRFVETEDGLIGYGRNNTGLAYQFTSTDNGNTWSRPVLTNIRFSRNVPVAPYYVNNKLIIVTCDRYGNGFYKYELLPHIIFNNPSQYPEPELLNFSSSRQTYRDWGYGNIIPYNSLRISDLAFVFYTTGEKETTLGGRKGCAICLYYFNIEKYKTVPNILRNGNLKDLETTNINPNETAWLGDNVAIKSLANVTGTKGSVSSGRYSYPYYLNTNNNFDLYSWIYGNSGVNTVQIFFYSYTTGILNIYADDELILKYNVSSNSTNIARTTFFNKKQLTRLKFEFKTTGNISLYEIGVSKSYNISNNYSSYYNDKISFYEELTNIRFTQNWKSSTNTGTFTNLIYNKKFKVPTIKIISNNNADGKLTPREGSNNLLDDVNVSITGITETKCNISAYCPATTNATLFLSNNIIIDCRPDISNI